MKNLHKDTNSIVFQNAFFDFETGKLLSPIKTQNFVIVQVAESFYRGGFNIGAHTQNCDLEITLSLTSGLYCSDLKNVEKLNANEIYLNFKGEKHSLSSKKNCRFQTLAINFKNGEGKEMLYALKQKCAKQRRLHSQEISDLFTLIISEFVNQNEPFFKIRLDSLISSVLVSAVRSGNEKTPNSLPTAQEPLFEIVNYIDSHFLEIAALSELSKKFGYTYSHICKIFKKGLSVAPKEYVSNKKIEFSKQLITEGKKFEEIASLLGYSNAYNFSRAFKNKTGLSPSEYKKTYSN